MAKKKDALLRDLSTADLKRLLVARERIDVLEKEKAALETSLGKIEAELDKLVASAVAVTGGRTTTGRKRTGAKAAGSGATGRKAAKKKTAQKKTAPKTARKKTAKKKVAKKKVAKKKAAKKKVTRKKAVGKTAVGKKVAAKSLPAGRQAKAGKKAVAGKRGTKKAAGKGTLEDVIVGVLGRSGGKLSYRDLYQAIVGGKLFATRSKNFDNVMRRTLSTSDRVKRVARGVYALA